MCIDISFTMEYKSDLNNLLFRVSTNKVDSNELEHSYINEKENNNATCKVIIINRYQKGKSFLKKVIQYFGGA